MRALAILLMVLMSAMGFAFAELVPDATFKDVPVAAEASSASVEFTLKNPGTAAVKILYVKTDFNVKVDPQEASVAPGGDVVLKFTYDIDWRMGDRTVKAIIRTDDAAHPDVAVSFTVHIPWYFKTEGPSEAFIWFDGDPPEERSLILTVPDNIPLELTSISNANPAFTVKFEKLLPKVYKLSITPPATSATSAEAVRTEVKLYSNFPASNPKHFPLDASVLIASAKTPPTYHRSAVVDRAKANVVPVIDEIKPAPSPSQNVTPAPAPQNAEVVAPSAPGVADAAKQESGPGSNTITITEQTSMKTLANGDVTGFADAKIGSRYSVLSVQGSQLILEDAQGRHYLINTSATNYATPSKAVVAGGTITIKEAAQMQTLANGEVSGVADAKVGSHYTLVSVQGARLVLQDTQGNHYLIDLSATDYVVP